MKITLNVGSGDRAYDFYPNDEYKCINFDTRSNLKKVDEVGDVRDLSRFPDEHFDYILASDILEHFPISKTNTLLQEWKRVLKTNCIIEFRLPDLEAICKKYVAGTNSAKVTSWLLYGGQDYVGNYHFVAFDRRWLSEVLNQNGFKVEEIKDADNNFELKARKI